MGIVDYCDGDLERSPSPPAGSADGQNRRTTRHLTSMGDMDQAATQALLDSLPEAVAAVGRDRRFLRVNAAFAERWGTEAPAAFAGRPVHDLLPRVEADTLVFAAAEAIRLSRPAPMREICIGVG